MMRKSVFKRSARSQRGLLLASVPGCFLFNLDLPVAQAQLPSVTTRPDLKRDLSDLNLSTNAQSYVPAGLQQSQQPNEGRLGVIGRDNRLPVTSHGYPWSAIGRVEGLDAEQSGYICTGTLVAPAVVLTNAHCALEPETHQPSHVIRFMPNMIEGRLQDPQDMTYVEAVYVGTDFSDSATPPNPNDWALLKLKAPLGQKYGTIGLEPLTSQVLTDASYHNQFALVGYSHDFPADRPGETAGADLTCSITGEQNNVLLHDCDTTGGSSGGPILAKINGQVKIVALNSAELSNQSNGAGIVNFAVEIPRIVEQIRRQSQQ